MDQWFEDLEPYMEQFLAELAMHIPGVKIRYVKIMPRPSWSEYGRRFTERIDNHVVNGLGRIYRIRVCQVPHMYKYRLKLSASPGKSDSVLPGLLDKYGVHMNMWAYCVFATSVVIPLLHNWFASNVVNSLIGV